MNANATITCRCGFVKEFVLSVDATWTGKTWQDARTALEVVADRHESSDVRRAYRHSTEIEIEEVR